MTQNTVFLIMRYKGFGEDDSATVCYAHRSKETADTACLRLNAGAPEGLYYRVLPAWLED